MRRIGVAMEKFDRIFRCCIRDGVIDFISHRDAAHGNGTICQRLCHGNNVRLDVEFLCGKSGAHPAKTGDDFVKYQQ